MTSDPYDGGGYPHPNEDPSESLDRAVAMFQLGENTRQQIGEMHDHVGKYGPLLEGYGIHTHIDEVAILIPDAATMWAWISLAVRAKDIAHVNSAFDHVEAKGPIHGHYEAHYEFLEIADQPYRIEAMQVANGHSPLHAAHAHLAGLYGAWVHVSFKCLTELDYREICTLLADTGEWLPAQICHSTYGRFTYFSPQPELMEKYDLPALYLKPRVNLRDAV